MNAAEYQEHVKAQMAATPVGSLRHCLYSSEGVVETDRQITRGLRAWAIDRSNDRGWVASAIVFGACRSDALRRASAPARLGEEIYGETTEARRIDSDWDDAIEWPPL